MKSSAARLRFLQEDPWKAILLFVAGVLLFGSFHSPALSIYFSQDDIPLLVSVHPGWVPLSTAFFLMGSPREYRPLTQRYYFHFNQRLFGDDARLHHVMNLLVHFGSTLLVIWLAGRWFSWATAWIAGVVFALHPVHFHTTFWVSGIAQSGYTFFLLCTLALMSIYLSRAGLGWLLAATLTSAAAFLSKEDAVTLPVILLLLPWLEEGRWRLRPTLPFWLIGSLYVLLRFQVAGFGLPTSELYGFGFEVGRGFAKGRQYLDWLSIVPWLWLPSLLLGALWVRKRGDDSDLFRQVTTLALMGVVSLTPTFLVDSTAPHYLSFPVACVAWAVALFLAKLPGRQRLPAVLALLVGFIPLTWTARNLNLSSSSLDVPVPRKAELCRDWVETLRRSPPPIRHEGCRVLFRDFPLREWEKDWFAYMPSLAWSISVPADFVFFTEKEAVQTRSPCLYDWQFEGRTLRYVGMRRVVGNSDR